MGKRQRSEGIQKRSVVPIKTEPQGEHNLSPNLSFISYDSTRDAGPVTGRLIAPQRPFNPRQQSTPTTTTTINANKNHNNNNNQQQPAANNNNNKNNKQVGSASRQRPVPSTSIVSRSSISRQRLVPPLVQFSYADAPG
jgi:hypothetical protein